MNRSEEQKSLEDEKDFFKIIINGREKISPKRKLTFEDIIKLAFDNPDFKEGIIVYTITYVLPQTNQQGSIVNGEALNIKTGMVFNVTRTDKS